MEAQQLLDELGKHLGFALSLNEHGLCRVLFQEDAVDFEEDEGSLWLVAEVGPVPAGGREGIFGEMLAANAFGLGTKEAVLGMDAAKDAIFLHRHCPPGMEYPDFERVLIDFVLVLREWKSRLRDHVLLADD
ncbi:MAG: type III secretion system chaperone [Deltaproteobacteria bacterium]|nr:type III secretion system chaperone [Deltaproteobacteria bacterium]